MPNVISVGLMQLPWAPIDPDHPQGGQTMGKNLTCIEREANFKSNFMSFITAVATVAGNNAVPILWYHVAENQC